MPLYSKVRNIQNGQAMELTHGYSRQFDRSVDVGFYWDNEKNLAIGIGLESEEFIAMKESTFLDIFQQYFKYKNLVERGVIQVRLEIEKRFGPYRKPTEKTIPKFEEIQKKCLELALLIDHLCPESREKASALTELMMVRMFANASIAIHEEEERREG